ncbi:MAG TPA: DJ-1/PfpI family protein, partial [Acidimicrobiales bacterium]|nr:DJ-1/PfpI family protein [Acidimicrobiales bacterium]
MVVQDGCFASAVSSIIDIFTTAETVRPQLDPSIAPLQLSVVAGRRRVITSSGMAVTANSTLRDIHDFDVLVVPALGTLTAPDLEAALERRDGRALVRALGAVDPSRTRVTAACTGVFPLAETGLIDRRRATTTWFLTPTFRTRYPSVIVDLDGMVVADGPFLTAGAAFAHIDLALAVLRGVSVALARHVARLLLID